MKTTQFALLIISGLMFWSCQKGTASAALQIPHPDDASKQVEYFVEAPAGKGPWPTIVLLHGHQEGNRPGGKDFVDWGVLKQMSMRGYLAVAVSQPGYGKFGGSSRLQRSIYTACGDWRHCEAPCRSSGITAQTPH